MEKVQEKKDNSDYTKHVIHWILLNLFILQKYYFKVAEFKYFELNSANSNFSGRS